MSIEIITTSDGSHSLLNTALNETYHSKHGALQESVHVFIKEGLGYFLQTKSQKNISILEVGFGTGLNALLTLQHALELPNNIYYTSLETFPVPEEIWSQLNYIDSVGLKEKPLGMKKFQTFRISIFVNFKHHYSKSISLRGLILYISMRLLPTSNPRCGK
jgi:hypothetical protein